MNPRQDITVSVVMPSYNHGMYIERAIQSVLKQSFKDWELIIVDDGSEDDSMLVARKYQRMQPKKVFLLCHPGGENMGLPETLKRGICRARGKYIAFLESDDVWMANSLKEKVRALDAHESAVLAYTDVEMIGDDGPWRKKLEDHLERYVRSNKNTGPFYGFQVFHYNIIPSFSAVMARREYLDGLDFGIPKKHISWVDQFLWAQLSVFGKFLYLPRKLSYWRVHVGSQNQRHMASVADEAGNLESFRKHMRKAVMPMVPRYMSSEVRGYFNSKYRAEKDIQGVRGRRTRLFLAWVEGKRNSANPLYSTMVRVKDAGWRVREELARASSREMESKASQPTKACPETMKPPSKQKAGLIKGDANPGNKPKISVILPVCKPEPDMLKEAVDSVFAQTYADWELCVVAGGQKNRKILDYLASLKDDRVKITRLNRGGVIPASNEALKLACGSHVCILGQRDLLSHDALHEIAMAAEVGDPDMLYTDEAILGVDGGMSYAFKPDYSPDTLLSGDYVRHLVVYRKTLLDEVGFFRNGLCGSHEFDLALRFVEKARSVHHIPKVLHLTREDKSYGKNKAGETSGGVKAVEEALKRRGITGKASEWKTGIYSVRREIKYRPLVSIIIPYRDRPELLKKCIGSVLSKTTYENIEILCVDNGSTAENSRLLAGLYKKNPNVKFLRAKGEFNYSRINNRAVGKASGEHIVLLNNDTEVISPGWVEAMLEHSQRPEVGAVGAKLLYKNNTIQHAGVIVGYNGAAENAFLGLPDSAVGYMGLPNMVRNVSAVTAACLMVKKKTYEKAGGLDEESLKVSFNDVDFCVRLLQTGRLNIYTPHAVLYHLESASRGKDDTPSDKLRSQKEAANFAAKHKAFLAGGDPYYNPNMALESASYAPSRLFSAENELSRFKRARNHASP